MSDMPDAVEMTKDKAHYLADLERTGRSAPGWVNSLRQAGASRFAELDFPHRRMEDWRFTNVAPIVRTPFRTVTAPAGTDLSEADVAPFRYGESAWTELVFVDGFYAEGLSRHASGIRAGSLAGVLASADGAPLETHLNAGLNGTSNVFAALNTAFLLDGAFVHLDVEQAVESPIHLIFVSTGRLDGAAVHPRNLIVADRHSQATVIESYVSLSGDANYLNNVVSEISLGEGARLRRVKLLHEGPNGYHLSTTRVRQDRDSGFRSTSVFLGGRIARNELAVTLNGEGADASLNGLYMSDGEQLVDNALSIDHAKPNCTSWIGYKGVLQDKSHGVFSGKILVRRNAQKTDSKQLNQNMVLSDKATIDTKPLLEIFADDVKCTHGATVGRPPKELVFYFQTRGMSEAMALGMLTYGFADEVVNQIEVEPVRQRLEKFVFNKYSPFPG